MKKLRFCESEQQGSCNANINRNKIKKSMWPEMSLVGGFKNVKNAI